MLNPKFVAAAVLVTMTLIAGVIVGWLNVRNARGPRERRFVRRACAGMWLLVMFFVASILFLAPPYQYVAPALLAVIITAVMYRWATVHQLVREIDARERDKA